MVSVRHIRLGWRGSEVIDGTDRFQTFGSDPYGICVDGKSFKLNALLHSLFRWLSSFLQNSPI